MSDQGAALKRFRATAPTELWELMECSPVRCRVLPEPRRVRRGRRVQHARPPEPRGQRALHVRPAERPRVRDSRELPGLPRPVPPVLREQPRVLVPQAPLGLVLRAAEAPGVQPLLPALVLPAPLEAERPEPACRPRVRSAARESSAVHSARPESWWAR
jgi:hypothetical protein